MLIPKMESKIWLDSIKWPKNCDFWFFRRNDENPNFWLWSAIAQKRKGFISYHHHFIHIQGICYNMTYRVLARFDPRVVLTWSHFKFERKTCKKIKVIKQRNLSFSILSIFLIKISIRFIFLNWLKIDQKICKFKI